MSNKRIIAVTGGIGSGKSVVCRILGMLGYYVYDCDSRAKAIMDGDIAIKFAIRDRICAEAIDDCGNLDRKAISSVVFADPDKLKALNAIVHTAVIDDFMRWQSAIDAEIAFVETAILYQSGMDKLVNQVWEVVSPEEMRIERVCRRNALSPTEVKARIDSQRMVVDFPHPDIKVINNDADHSLLIQIRNLLSKA